MNKEYTAFFIMILNIMHHLDRRDFITIDLGTDFLVVSWEDYDRTDLCATFQSKHSHYYDCIHYLHDNEHYFDNYLGLVLEGKHIITSLKLNEKYLTDMRV